MKKDSIKKLIGDTTELTTSTLDLLEKTGVVLSDDLFSEKDGKQIIETLYLVIDEVGNKMPKYLINSTCSKLLNTDLEPAKIEKWYNALMED